MCRLQRDRLPQIRCNVAKEREVDPRTDVIPLLVRCALLRATCGFVHPFIRQTDGRTGKTMDARNVNVFNLTTNGCGCRGREGGKGVREAEGGDWGDGTSDGDVLVGASHPVRAFYGNSLSKNENAPPSSQNHFATRGLYSDRGGGGAGWACCCCCGCPLVAAAPDQLV